jgi:hypothetical protein
MFSLAAFFVGNRDHRTQLWKGAIQGSFHKSLVAIGPVVSEEKIFMKECRQAKHRKKWDEIKKKSSPLKLLSQSLPNFCGMILG